MKIAIGCDHGGYDLKEDIVRFLQEKGHEVKDCGTYSKESCDYPIFGEAAARAVASGECERGIVMTAEMTRRHNDANMLALGAGITGKNLAERCVEVFLTTEFEGGRHARRVALLDSIEP